MRIALTGRTAHASTPDQGISPMPAVSRLMPALAALGSAKSPGEDLAMATVTHARLGEPAFGVAPGYAEIWATLRTLTDARMAALAAQAEGVARNAAAQAALAVAIDYADVFLHCENDPEATAQLRHALEAEGVPHGSRGLPMRASEDFGRFGKDARAALFLLGAGEDHPGLHNPDFDFPDALIAVGARVFMRILHHQLG
jgi:metal-dependent amidase/aminoacylase/carboxypeptidase family protein